MTGIDRLRALKGEAREIAMAVVGDWVREIDALEVDGPDPDAEAVIEALLDAVIDMECALVRKD